MSVDNVALVQAISPVITWVLVIAGWFIVSNQSDGREGRKELRSRLDTITTLIYEIHDQATQFYLKSGSDSACPALRGNMVRNLQRLGVLVTSAVGGAADDSLVIKVADFRRAITLNEFDDNGRLAKTYSDGPLTQILESANAICREIEDRYKSSYSSYGTLKP